MAEAETVGQDLHGSTWGGSAGRYADYRNGRFAWFKQAKFGIFIHWGLYSVLEGQWQGREYHGIAEWIMRVLQIPVREYEKVAGRFTPERFDAGAWAALFREAGAQYVTLTAKHHDGFCLFDSKVSAFTSTRTAAGRDIVGELGEACRAHDLRLCLYYSQDQDWHEPQGGGNDWDFPPAGRTAEGRRRYVDGKVRPQLRELLTGYGPIGYIWFDTPGYLAADEARAIRAEVHAAQPECMASSRLGHDLGDFESLPDQMVPADIHYHRCETAMTHNDSWACSRFDTNWKSPRTLIRQLVRTVSCGANYLLNIGPRADGNIPAESVAALRRIGAWLKVNGESIYGADPNPLGAAMPWGVCTAKPGRIYAHIMDPPTDGCLLIPWSGAVHRAELLATGAELAVSRRHDRLHVQLPAELPDADVSVVVLHLAAEARRHLLVLPNQVNSLPAAAAEGADVIRERVSWMHETFGNWHHRDVLILPKADSTVHFDLHAVAPGTYSVRAEYASRPAPGATDRHTLAGPGSVPPLRREASTAVLSVDDCEYNLCLPPIDPGYFTVRTVADVPIRLAAGDHRLRLRAANDGFPELVRLKLHPVAT